MAVVLVLTGAAAAQSGQIVGTVRDDTGGILAGAAVELTIGSGEVRRTETDVAGTYRFEQVTPGRAQVAFLLVNFATARRDVVVAASPVRIDAVLSLSLNADVTVTGKATFTNLGTAPSSTPTPASGFTATTRVARRSP